MAQVVDVRYAELHLPALLAAVEGGSEVIIARDGTQVARLVAVRPAVPRELGFVAYRVPATFFDSLAEDELRDWEP